MGRNLTWQTVGTVAALGAVAVGLGALTSMTPSEITALVAVLAGVAAGGAIGGAVVGGVQARTDEIQAETQRQTETINTIERRTNGELDQRIAAAMEEAAETGAARAIRAMRQESAVRQTSWPPQGADPVRYQGES